MLSRDELEVMTVMSGVLVLNAGYEPLHRVSVQHAIRMLVREVAVVEEADEDRAIGSFPFPRVLRLVRYVAMRWKSREPRWSRRRVLERDNERCVYCGSRATTIDHIVPVCQGGRSTWENTVAACKPCNNRKGSRSLEDVGFSLRTIPTTPSWWQVAAAQAR